MFRQAKQSRVFEDVVSQIQEAILEEKFKAGDKLPSERNLREVFKVSRGTLREALRALEQKKLIYIKTGASGGAIICPIDTRPVSDSLDLLLRYQKVSLGELAEFREAVEGLLAAKAARRATKEDLKGLDILLESIKNHLHSGELRWNEIIKDDRAFHLSLARIAGNRVFESILYTVYENITRYFERFLPKDGLILERIYQDLCKIKKAIDAKDPNRTKTIVREHVRRFNRLMEAR